MAAVLEASGVTLARQAQLGSDEKLIVGTGTGARAAAAAALDCARQGERALIVCRDEGVLRELKKAIKLIGIGDLALAISESTSQEELRKELVRTLALEQPAKPPTGDFAGQLKTVNTKLEEYRQMLASILSGSIDPRSAGLSDTLMLRALLRSCVGQFELEALRTLPSDKRAGVLNLAQRLQDHLTAHGSPQANPFLGSGVRTEDLSPGSTIQDSLAAAAGSSAVYAEEFRVFAAELGLSVHLQDQHNLAALKALAVVEATFTANGANMRHVDFDSDKWTAGESQLISALERARHFRHLIESYPDPINLQALAALDLDSAEEVFSKGKIGRLLSLDYRGLREDLAAVTRVPEDASGQQLVLSKLKEIRAVQRQMRGDEKLWSELYGDSLVQLRSEVPELRYWQHLSQLTERLIEFSKLTSEHPERERLIRLMRKPDQVYESAEWLEEVLEKRADFERDLGRVIEVCRFDRQDKRLVSSVGESCNWLKLLHKQGLQIESIASFNELCAEANRLGCGFLIDMAESYPASAPPLAGLVKQGLEVSGGPNISRAAISANLFSDLQYKQMLAQARELVGLQSRELSREAAAAHWRRLPNAEAGGEALMLTETLQRGAGHDLMKRCLERAPHALQALKPIIAVTPESIGPWAQESAGFDRVITLGTSDLIQSDAPMTLIEETESAGDLPLNECLEVGDRVDEPDALLSFVERHMAGHGFTVHTGVSPQIDLAVVDPADPQRYLLGLRLDWRRLKSGEPAYRQLVEIPEQLNANGWRIVTQSLLGWYWEPEKQLQELLQICKSTEGSPEPRQPREEEQSKRLQDRKLNVPYCKAELDLGSFSALRKISAAAMNDVVLQALSEIVRKEGPILRDNALERLREGFKMRDLANELVDAYEKCERAGVERGLFKRRDQFLYPPPEVPLAIRDRSMVRGRLREIASIPPEEVELALMEVIGHAHGIQTSKAIEQACYLLGFRTLPGAADTVCSAALGRLYSDGLVASKGGYLHPVAGHNN